MNEVDDVSRGEHDEDLCGYSLATSLDLIYIASPSFKVSAATISVIFISKPICIWTQRALPKVVEKPGYMAHCACVAAILVACHVEMPAREDDQV